ncbi:hypothetical protein GCM10022279_17870 [Comamonas faecalis]|uniref:DUF2523 domain-containing protein n=1 Tax=Comamonas faecalis TaxID=1387849 RepID=A0ABP7RAM1_9BURK
MKLGTWLLALMEPMLARILAALGFSVVTVTGFDLAVNQIKQLVMSQVNSLPMDMLNLFLYAGGGYALGMIFGAVTTKLLLWQIQSATKILGANVG